MAIFVKEKKLQKRRISYKREKRQTKEVWKFFSTWYFWLVLLVLFLLFGIYTILQYTLYASANYIHSVSYSLSSMKEYSDPYLYDWIKSQLSWKNYYLFNFFDKNTVTDTVISQHPIVSNIEYASIWPNSVSVTVDFHEPEILIKMQDNKYWVYQDYVFALYSWNTLWTGLFTVELPNYLSWTESIKWLFYDIWVNKFKADLYQIHNSFPQADRIVYLPWAMATVVFVYDKMVYIHHDADITQQIQTFYMIEKYYWSIDNIRSLDLWSLDLDKVIARDF